MTSARTKAYLFLLIATALWGIAGPVIKFTLGGVEPLLFLTYRFAITSVVTLSLFAMGVSKFPKDGKTRLLLFLHGFFHSTVALGLLFFGLQNTSILDMTLITLIAPLLVAESGVRFLHERLTAREKFGMTVALIGTILIVIEPLVGGVRDDLKISGNALILLYLLSNMVPAILTKKLLKKGLKPITLSHFQFLVGFITLAPFALYKYGFAGILSTVKNLDFKYQLGVLFMAFLSGSVAYTLFNKGQKMITVGEAAIFSYLHPLFAAPLAILWLGEKINPQFIFGGIIIALGVFIAEYRKTKLSKVERASS